MKFFRVKNKKILPGVVIIIAAISLIVYLKVFRSEKRDCSEYPKVVETEIVKKTPFKHRINLIGTVRPKNYCVLTAKTGGTIDTLIPAGSNVKKGDIIAKIENADIEKTYNLSISAKEIAQSQHNRVVRLVKQKVSSQKELEDSRKNLIDADKDLAKASIDMQNMLVKAPFDGILGAYKIKDGEQVSEGNHVATFYNHDRLLVEFDIPSQYIRKINVGQEVVMKEDGRGFALKHVQKAIDEESYMCPASFELPDPDGTQIIGASVDLALTVEAKDQAIVIPFSAVYLYEGREVVYVVRDGKAEISDIKVGIRNDDSVEVLSGLKEGDEIIILGQDRLYPGISVKIATKN